MPYRGRHRTCHGQTRTFLSGVGDQRRNKPGSRDPRMMSPLRPTLDKSVGQVRNLPFFTKIMSRNRAARSKKPKERANS